MSIQTLALIAIAVLLLPALTLVVVGWVGRRVGDHPYCRACGFDLFGLPLGSARCSECGAGVTRAGAVVVGRHQHRTALVFVGLAMMFVGAVAGTAVLVRPWYATKVVVPAAPIATSNATPQALSAALMGRGYIPGPLALAELVARLNRGALSTDDLSMSLRTILAAGPVPPMPDARLWFEHLALNGLADADTVDRYLRELTAIQVAGGRQACVTTDPFPVRWFGGKSGAGLIHGKAEGIVITPDGTILFVTSDIPVDTATPLPQPFTLAPRTAALAARRGEQKASVYINWTWQAGSGRPMVTPTEPSTLVIVSPQ